MATTIVMPRLGNTVESSVILEWKVKEGDQVHPDTVLCEIETDKATMEVPAGAEGRVLKLLWKAGDDVPVLKPIAIIGEAGEKVPAEELSVLESGTSGPSAAETSVPRAAVPRASVSGGADPGTAVSETSVPGIAASAPLDTGASHGERVLASPRARRAMEKFAIDETMIAQGSGPHGRIMEKDVLEVRKTPVWQPEITPDGQAAQAGKAPASPSPEEAFRDVQLAGIRARIAARMKASLQNHAQYTLHSSANAERLLALRAKLKSSTNPGQSAVTIGDLVLYAVIRLLPEFPEFNATLQEGALRLWKPIHLGVAVDAPRGLMVPVVRNAESLSLIALSKEVKRLASACQKGTIEPDLLSGSTFTVTNLGAFGIERFTPVLNAPETAILGVCAIQPALVQEEGRIRTQMRIGLSLTADHQVIDGAYGARFLQRLSAVIADIDSLFLSFE